jgi:hypothetical protein
VIYLDLHICKDYNGMNVFVIDLKLINFNFAGDEILAYCSKNFCYQGYIYGIHEISMFALYLSFMTREP